MRPPLILRAVAAVFQVHSWRARIMTLPCPRDGTPLVPQTHDGVTYHACGVCRGLLLPLEMVPELVPVLPEIRNMRAAWPRSSVGCPCCGRTMHLVLHDGIEIDLCHYCTRVWLDHGEIEKLRERTEIDGSTDQAEAEAEPQDINSEGDALGESSSDVLDWLGEAIGSLSI